MPISGIRGQALVLDFQGIGNWNILIQLFLTLTTGLEGFSAFRFQAVLTAKEAYQGLDIEIVGVQLLSLNL